MAAVAKPFRNKENYAKYLALYFEPGLTVLLTTLRWCYKGQRPIEEHLADLGATNSLRKLNFINTTEQNTLEEIKEGKTNLNDLDITLIYKIIQLTCSLLPRYDEVWKDKCPTSRQGELEFLLSQLKDGRNKLAHPRDEQKNITDLMVEDKCKEVKDLLTKLLQAAALKANLDLSSSEFNKINKHIEDDIQRILKGENVCDSMSDHTLDLILADLKARHFINDELKATFMKEIEEYSAPSLKDRDGFHPLKDILQLNKSPVIVVQGEAGMGKTTLSRILSHSWLSGITDDVEGLSSFDMVLKVDCNQVFSSDIHLFYETLLPGASFAFPNTNSLKRSLDGFKVFWIMDGFDECTAQFKSFLTAMVNSLSEKHKLLITTRPNTYKDLKDIICKYQLSMTTLALELLQYKNMEEIIKNLFIDHEEKENFKTHFSSLHETAKQLLRIPLNFNLYIHLWKQDKELVHQTYTTKMLYLKTTINNMKILKKKLDGRTIWSSQHLPGFVEQWFYGSLCKQSFLMLLQNRFNIISPECLKNLAGDAIKSQLDPSSCLSMFLIQEREHLENDEEDKGEIGYKFHHLTQQFILASLFLEHFKDYDGDNAINSIYTSPKSIISIGPSLNLLTFYVEMVKEDGSLDANLTQIVSTIQTMINKHSACTWHEMLFWFSTSVASNFNAKYLEYVFQEAIYGFLIHEIDQFNDFLNLTKFLKFVQPKKINIIDLLSTTWKVGFSTLRDFLIKFKIEIELSLNNDNFYKKYVEVDKEFVTADSNWLSELDNLEKVLLSRPVEDELWINFHSSWFPSDYLTVPKLNVENTSLRLFNVKKLNFEKVLEFLIKIRGGESSKFKALYHDWNEISETGKSQLIEICHSVVNDPSCQLKEFCIQQIVHLNVTSFRGIMSTLDFLKTHHANLKTIFLHIYSEVAFCRMLTFLHENKTTLSDVSISLTGHDFSTFQHWERRTFFDENRSSENGFTFPKELVQHAILYMGEINGDNFQDYFRLLNSVKGEEDLKFKHCSYNKLILSPDKRQLLEQMTNSFICVNDSKHWPVVRLNINHHLS